MTVHQATWCALPAGSIKKGFSFLTSSSSPSILILTESARYSTALLLPESEEKPLLVKPLNSSPQVVEAQASASTLRRRSEGGIQTHNRVGGPSPSLTDSGSHHAENAHDQKNH
jgi:hypothetical protein